MLEKFHDAKLFSSPVYLNFSAVYSIENVFDAATHSEFTLRTVFLLHPNVNECVCLSNTLVFVTFGMQLRRIHINCHRFDCSVRFAVFYSSSNIEI